MSRPQVLLTRRIPAKALARIEEMCDVEFLDGGSLTSAELAAKVPGKHGLVTMFIDPVDAAVLAAATDLKVVATVAVGYNNIDVAGREGARHRGHQHARRVDRGHGRSHDGRSCSA